MATTTTPSLVGKDIDAWCNKCKLMLAHTIVALKGGVPYKVQCNTCEAGHVYRSAKPGTKKRSTRPPKPTEYERALKKLDPETAVAYKPSAAFETGALITHKTLGLGIITGQRGPAKIEVLFPAGERILIHNH